jgi:hypothetical protein
VVDYDKEHGGASEEDGERVELVVGNHLGVRRVEVAIREAGWLRGVLRSGQSWQSVQ